MTGAAERETQIAVRNPPERLVFLDPHWSHMIAHLQECLPNEGVGLLSVIEGENALISAQYYPGRNVDASSTRYTMDPEQVLAAFRDMAWRGTKLGAIVHSHPRTPPMPSRLDLAEATLPYALVVIAGFEPVVDVRAWRLEFGRSGRAIRGREVPIDAPPREAVHRGRIGAKRIDRAGSEGPLDQLERRR